MKYICLFVATIMLILFLIGCAPEVSDNKLFVVFKVESGDKKFRFNYSLSGTDGVGYIVTYRSNQIFNVGDTLKLIKQ